MQAWSEPFAYDVFLSHSSRDKEAVRRLAERLRGDGLRVWFDEWELKPGDAILHKVEQGLEQSARLVLVMSPSAFAKPDWLTLESHTIRFRDPMNRDRRFVPLLLKDVEIPAAVRQFLHVDWRKQSPTEYEKLLAACGPERGGGAKASPPAAKMSGATRNRRTNATVGALTDAAGWEQGTPAVACLATLAGHTDTVHHLALTADGGAVSASDDRALRVWDVERSLAALATPWSNPTS